MFTPVLRSLKEKFPTCHITVVCRDNHRDVLTGLPYIDKVACIYRGKPFGRYRSIPALLNQDVIIFTDWHVILMLFARLFRTPRIIGFGKEGHFLTKCLKTVLKGPIHLSPNYVACTNAKFISDVLDIKLEGDMTKPDISAPTIQDVQSVDKMLADIGLKTDAPYILMTPFTGSEQRNLPLNTAIEVVQSIEKKYNLPVVISAPSEKNDLAKKISKFVVPGSTSIRELVELVDRSKMLISPDSGPIHVAAAVGKNCVAIFSKELPSRWAPKKNCIPLYLNLSCSPCDDETARNCSHLKCIRGITADMIVEACDKFINNLKE